MTEQEIHTICEKYNITNYTINPDGSIDVDGNVNLIYMRLTKIPIKFNKVSGNFDCSRNNLTSLRGCPIVVGGAFFCCYNNLTSLIGSPDSIRKYIMCDSNPLESIEGYNGNFNKLICKNRKKLVEKEIIDRKKKKRKEKLKIIEKL